MKHLIDIFKELFFTLGFIKTPKKKQEIYYGVVIPTWCIGDAVNSFKYDISKDQRKKVRDWYLKNMPGYCVEITNYSGQWIGGAFGTQYYNPSFDGFRLYVGENIYVRLSDKNHPQPYKQGESLVQLFERKVVKFTNSGEYYHIEYRSNPSQKWIILYEWHEIGPHYDRTGEWTTKIMKYNTAVELAKSFKSIKDVENYYKPHLDNEEKYRERLRKKEEEISKLPNETIIKD